MGEVVAFRQRDPYLRDVETMLAKPVDEPWGCEVRYRCADRAAAGALSRRLRADLRRRGWPVVVQQFHDQVFVWRVLTADQQELVRRAIAETMSDVLWGVRRPRPVR